MPSVNPEILIWARETSGLATADAAPKLMSGETAVARLEALEQGAREPTRAMLAKMSAIYRRPLLTFYLPRPPQPSDQGQDFRTLREPPPPGEEALLAALLRDIHTRQGLVKAAIEEAEEDQPLPFIGSARIDDGIERVVGAIREVLGVDRNEFRRQRTAADAFRVLRAGAEQAGVFVLLLGNLGSHHTKLDAKHFRGFALADNVAPFVVINENDSRAAWSFTLIHELAHLWLGQTGVSGYDGAGQTERFCDLVAARYLLDTRELRQLGAVGVEDAAELKDRITEFANERRVSRKMVAYNLLRARQISAPMYRELNTLLDEERAASDQERQGRGAGADYYVVRRHRVGPGLVGLVRRMVAGRTLSMTKAARVLGVKPTGVVRLVKPPRPV